MELLYNEVHLLVARYALAYPDAAALRQILDRRLARLYRPRSGEHGDAFLYQLFFLRELAQPLRQYAALAPQKRERLAYVLPVEIFLRLRDGKVERHQVAQHAQLVYVLEAVEAIAVLAALRRYDASALVIAQRVRAYAVEL